MGSNGVSSRPKRGVFANFSGFQASKGGFMAKNDGLAAKTEKQEEKKKNRCKRG